MRHYARALGKRPDRAYVDFLLPQRRIRFLIFLLSLPCFACFRFPHYLLGLSHQRAAGNISDDEVKDAEHRNSIRWDISPKQCALVRVPILTVRTWLDVSHRALLAAEKLAPGWLNLAAARADSYQALKNHNMEGPCEHANCSCCAPACYSSQHFPLFLACTFSAKLVFHCEHAARGKERLL